MARRKRERRKPGTGYTTQAQNGTWNALFPKAGGGYHVRRGFNTRPLAEAWLNSLAEQTQARGDVGGGQQRVGTWMETWATRAAKEREWKAKTIVDVAWKLGYIQPHIGSMALADVLPDHIDAMLDALRASLAETTTRQIRNYLWQVFDEARERRYITYNPVIKPHRRKRTKQREPQRLSAPQALRIIHAAEPSFYALAWWLILVLGLRAGEVCGLRWGDLDLDTATVHIAQEVTDLRGTPHIDRPKNDKERILPYPRALLPLLQLHQRAYISRAAQGTRQGYWQEHGLVFPGRGGRPMNPTSLLHQLRQLTNACKLPPVTTHMLRHTAAKFYIDLNCPQHIVSALLGHTTNITGHYAPPDAEVLRPWVEQVYRLLAGSTDDKHDRREG